MSKITIVCLGSLWYIEDRAGLAVCEELNKRIVNSQGVSIVVCETGIERCTGIILRERPNVLVVVDSILVLDNSAEEYLGNILVIDNLLECDESLIEGISTHKMPLKLILKFIKSEVSDLSRVVFVGIPVNSLTFCPPDEECDFPDYVKSSVMLAVEYIASLAREARLENFEKK